MIKRTNEYYKEWRRKNLRHYRKYIRDYRRLELIKMKKENPNLYKEYLWRRQQRRLTARPFTACLNCGKLFKKMMGDQNRKYCVTCSEPMKRLNAINWQSKNRARLRTYDRANASRNKKLIAFAKEILKRTGETL